MLSVAPFSGSPVGAAKVQHLTSGGSQGCSDSRRTVMPPHLCFSSSRPRGSAHIRANGGGQAASKSSTSTDRRPRSTKNRRTLASEDTSKASSTARTASWMTQGATESATTAEEARTETPSLVLPSSQLPPKLMNTVYQSPSSISSMSSSSAAIAGCGSAGADAHTLQILRAPQSSLPVTSSDDGGSWSVSFQSNAAPTLADSPWVPYDVYLSLSASLLHDRALQDRVATLCCPMTWSEGGHSKLVDVRSVLPFFRHGDAVVPPATSTTTMVTATSAFPSSLQSPSLRSTRQGLPSDEAQRASFPLFCLLGAKMCTISRRTHCICSIHSPRVPIAERFAMGSDQRGGVCSHTRNSDDTAGSPYPARQQDHAARLCGGAETVPPHRGGCRDDVLLLFAEQLIDSIPTFPVELLYTTSPTGDVVSAPPVDAAVYWDSWQRTPRTVRRTVSYDKIWSVVPLSRLVAMLQRWGVSPAVAIRRLCARALCSCALPLESRGDFHSMSTTVCAVPQDGREAMTAEAMPRTGGALRRLPLSLEESNSCLFASKSSAQMECKRAEGLQQPLAGSLAGGSAAFVSFSTDIGATLVREVCASSVGGTSAVPRTPANMSTCSGRATAVECDNSGPTRHPSHDVFLSNSLKGDTDSSLHPYNALGVSSFVSTAADGNHLGQAHRYEIPSPLPRALSSTQSFGSFTSLQAAASGVPLRRSSTPSLHHQRLQYQSSPKSSLRLRLLASLSLASANRRHRTTKSVPVLNPRYYRHATSPVIAGSRGTVDSSSDVLAHPYQMPASEETQHLGIQSRRGHIGRGTRHSRHDINNQRTRALNGLVDSLRITSFVDKRGQGGVSVGRLAMGDSLVSQRAAHNAAKSKPAVTPPTREGTHFSLGARQRTEQVTMYLQTLTSAAAHQRAGVPPKASYDKSQQRLQRSTDRRGANEFLTTASRGTGPSRTGSSCDGAGVDGEGNLSFGRGCVDSGGAGVRRVPMPPSSPRQNQPHLYASPHTNILQDYSTSINAQRGFTLSTGSGRTHAAALGDPVAGFCSMQGDRKAYGCSDARIVTDVAPSPCLGASMVPSMPTSSEGSLVSLATVSAVIPDTHSPHHPKEVSDVRANSCTADGADRSAIEKLPSAPCTPSLPSNTLASLKALLHLASTSSSMRACGPLNRYSKPSAPPISSCLQEDTDVCPRPCVPPELSSGPLSFPSHPTPYPPAGAEHPRTAAAVGLSHDGYRTTDTTALSPTVDVPLLVQPPSLIPHAPNEVVMSYGAAVPSADHLSRGPSRAEGSADRHLRVERATVGRSILSMSDLSFSKGGTSHTQPIRANAGGSGAPPRPVAEPTVPDDPQLHIPCGGQTSRACDGGMPGSVRRNGTAPLTASILIPTTSPDNHPSVASPHSNLGSADLLVSTSHEDAEWPTFLPSSLLGSTLAITTHFSSDADDPRTAISNSPSADSESVLQWADTAALLLNLAACVVQAVGRGYIARRDLRKQSPAAASDQHQGCGAVTPSVMPSSPHTLSTVNLATTSCPTEFPNVSSAPLIVRDEEVVTPRQGPPPPLNGFSPPLTSPAIGTATMTATVSRASRLAARHFPLRARTLPRRRSNAASQTLPVSSKISSLLHTAAVTRSYPNELVGSSELRPKQSVCLTDTGVLKESSASQSQCLSSMRDQRVISTSENSGVPTPACAVGATGLPTAPPDEADTTAVAGADACSPPVALSFSVATSKHTFCASLDSVPQRSDSGAGNEHQPAGPGTLLDNSTSDEQSGAAARARGLVDSGTLVSSAVSPPPLHVASLKVSSVCEGTASVASHDSTEGWMGILPPPFSGTPSSTMTFVEQAVAKGPSRRPKAGEAHRSMCLKASQSVSGVLSSQSFRGTNPVVVADVLQVQRIGRGYLTRRQCRQRYWEEHEERSLDLLLQRVLLQAPIPFVGETPVKEKDKACGIGDEHIVSGVSTMASVITGLCSNSSSSQTSDRISSTPSLPPSTPSASRASSPPATLMPGNHRFAQADMHRAPGIPLPTSLLFPEETIYFGSEDAVGISAGDALFAANRSPVPARRGETLTMQMTPDHRNYAVSPILPSTNQRTSVLFTSPLSNVIGSGLASEANELLSCGAGGEMVQTSSGGREAKATDALHEGSMSHEPVSAVIRGTDVCSGDVDSSVAPPLVPTMTISLSSTAASPSVDANVSGKKNYYSAFRSPPSSRSVSQSPPSLRVSFPRCSYPSSANLATVRATVSAAPVDCPLGASISHPMGLSGTRPTARTEGTHSSLSHHRSPPPQLVVQGSPRDGVPIASVERSSASVCHASRRRFFASAARAELSPMDGSIFAMSGRSARSLNSMNSLPFSFSVTANAMSVTGQNFSSLFSEGISLQPWVLDGVQIVSTFSSDSDSSGSSDDEVDAREGRVSSSNSSDSGDACNDTAGDSPKRDLIHVDEAGAEPACFGAAAQALGHASVPLSMTKALVRLQRIGRGYLCRRHQHFLFMVSISWAEIALIQRVALGYLQRKRICLEYFVHCEARRQMSYWDLRNRSAVLIQSIVRGFNGRQRAKRLQRRVFTRIELLTAVEQLDTDS